MPEFDVNNLATVGLIRDIPGFQLRPEAFTTALNGRFDRDGFVSGPAWAEGFDEGIAPHFLWGIKSPALEDWLIIASLDTVKAFDGTASFDITGTSGPYNASFSRDWNSTLLGGIPILNTGADDPQFWEEYDGGTVLQDLTNWPANTTAKILRAFGPNLVAFDVTEAGVHYGSLVWWSHPADPGALPISWDYADPTIDSGRTDIVDEFGGPILDALQLHDAMVIYKGGSTWLMRRIGGPFIFQFDQLFTMSGLLCTRAVAATGDGNLHFLATQDDVVVHDGNKIRSICDRRMRRTVFNAIDVANARNSFCFANPREREMWFCYPETGQEQPSRALVWRYGEATDELGVLSEQEIDFECATVADLAVADESWDSDSQAWDDDNESWDQSDRRRVLLGRPASNNEIHIMDESETRDDVAFTTTLTREHFGFLGRRPTGEPILNFRERKFLRRVWIKAEGAPFQVRVGVSEFPQESVTWEPAVTFTPEEDDYVDFLVSGSSVSVEFSGTSPFKVFGYTLEWSPAGRFP